MNFFSDFYDNDNSSYYASPRQREQQKRYQAYQRALREEQIQREKKIALMKQRRNAYEENERLQHGREQAARSYDCFDMANDPREPRDHLPTNSGRRSRRQQYPMRNSDENYKIVRGSDGRLYRVHKNDLNERYPENFNNSSYPSQQPRRSRRTTKDRSTRSTGRDDVDVRAPVEAEGTENTDPQRTSQVKASRTTTNSKSLKPKSSRRKKKITVIVEDASDSEYESDDLNSVWRNRRPEAGESWMEPVAQ